MSNSERAHSTTKPAHHTRMLDRCIEAGWIKRVGDAYEITPAGHAYTMAQSAKLHATEAAPYRSPSSTFVPHHDGPYNRWGA